ncbi:TPR repeat-containing protein [Paenibacillus sp. UNCCL117]|uniref:tetratricopeptide repeat protein n=1 Tax=unclassified Paenibacillus TaxID=185978 RepID=UPI00087F7A8C|nr:MULTISPECIES: tetratricopeptide repeat protein [unclassified Paenibacillus]SDC41566.1 TPR repeat-containing protein [Paenibacillus sp. cl123]SFW13490.1 TPR repeat-containing protein [Paenibacillus sp. UNCCL117]
MDGEFAIKKAYESILQHDFEQAIRWFETAIALKPECASYHYKLSITYARSNKLQKAIHHAGQASALEPQDEHYFFHLQHLQAKALLVQAEKLFEESDERLWLAVSLVQQAVEMDPLSQEAFLLLAVAYARLGEMHLAIRAVKDLLKLDPDHAIGSRLLSEYELKWKKDMQRHSTTGVQKERKQKDGADEN